MASKIHFDYPPQRAVIGRKALEKSAKKNHFHYPPPLIDLLPLIPLARPGVGMCLCELNQPTYAKSHRMKWRIFSVERVKHLQLKIRRSCWKFVLRLRCISEPALFSWKCECAFKIWIWGGQSFVCVKSLNQLHAQVPATSLVGSLWDFVRSWIWNLCVRTPKDSGCD